MVLITDFIPSRAANYEQLSIERLVSTSGVRIASPPPTPFQTTSSQGFFLSKTPSACPDITSQSGVLQEAPTSEITVEELGQDDSQNSGNDVQRPYELEEAPSSGFTSCADADDEDDGATESEARDSDSTSGISRHLGRLKCKDIDLGEGRRRQMRKGYGASLLKRTHSRALGDSMDDEDIVVLDDNDSNEGARRLRRRVRSPHGWTGPKDQEVAYGGRQDWTSRRIVGIEHVPLRDAQSLLAQSRHDSPALLQDDPMDIDIPPSRND